MRFTSATRVKVRFLSGSDECVAWHYPGTNGACVVMAAGGGITKEPGTDPFAAPFHQAGYSVLAFDYRHLGESGGRPRQVVRPRRQVQDWDAALECARSLPEVDPARIAAWGFSLTGGHLFRVASRQPLAAVIVQTPLVDGLASTPNALRHETLGVITRMPALALADIVRSRLGGRPLTVPLAGHRGDVAMLTTPDAMDGDQALDPDGRYDWDQTIAARSVMRLTCYRPGREAAKARCPMLVIVCRDDRSALTAPAVKAARRVPDAELVELDGGHYAPFLERYEQARDAQLDFLDRRLGLATGRTARSAS